MAGGSTTGIIYAVRHPERIKRLVLYAPYTRNRLVGSPTTEKIDEVKARLKVMELGWDNQTPAYSHFFTSLHLPDSSAEQFNSLNELLRVSTSPVNLTGLLNALFMADVHDLLPKIQCPTLVLHSRGNSIIPFDEGRKAASLIPGARFVPIESRNHLVLDNEPGWETLVQAINEFFSRPQEGLLLDELTPREREVLELVAQGLTNQEIARSLKISDKTVRNQVSQILNKMGVKSRAQAVARARDIGYGHRFFAELNRN
jgi:DNA-binding CsgD family transcriptional regulator